MQQKENKLPTTWAQVASMQNLHRVNSLPFKNPKSKIEKRINAHFVIEHVYSVLNKGSKQNFWYAYWDISGSGFVFDCSYCRYGDGYAAVGARLRFKDEPTLLHAVKYFKPYFKLIIKP